MGRMISIEETVRGYAFPLQGAIAGQTRASTMTANIHVEIS